MLLIRAVSFKGRPIGREMAARFGEMGGTIGRGETSTLVLPDPERYISRTHATISFQAGGFVITDNGTKNPVLLNGRPLGTGQQARLGDGDTLTVGDYALQVGLAAGGGTPVPAPAAAAGPVTGGPKDDPLAALGTPASRIPDPFADLLGPSTPGGREESRPPAAPWPEPPRGPAPPLSDPLGTDRPGGQGSASRPADPLGQDPLAGLRGPDARVDDLFGLTPSDPFDLLRPERPPGEPGAQPGRAGAVDPLEGLLGPPRAVPPASVPDHGSEIFTPYIPPVARTEPALQVPRPAEPPAPPVPSAPPPPPAAAPQHPRSPAPAPRVAASHPQDALLRAFLEAAGIPEGRSPGGLTPEMMAVVGTLLRSAIQGTLDLLRARGLTKSELRADMTMIAAQDNNPLKFSPTAEAALRHLLGPPLPGFMAPDRAMKDAYDDLRAHQLGFLAGMRGALEAVLERFAPSELEQRLSDPSVLDSLLPMSRKGKLWDLFVERYQDVAGEAREGFDAAFSKAFLRAYEAQVKRLRAGGRRD